MDAVTTDNREPYSIVVCAFS